VLGACGVRDDCPAVAVEIDKGEHLAADGLIADPEDKVGAPLHGFDDVGEGEEEGADAFGVHVGSIDVDGVGLFLSLSATVDGRLLSAATLRSDFVPRNFAPGDTEAANDLA